MTKKSFFIAAAVLLLIAGVIIGCMLLSGEKETRKNISKIDPYALPVNIRTASYAYDIYQEYKTAIKNEIVPKGCQRDVSIYDKKE